MWTLAGQLLILLLLVPAIAEATPDRTPGVNHLVESSDRSTGSAHDCCPADEESAAENDSRDNSCTGTYFCTCTLQATPSSKGVVPAPDQPLAYRIAVTADLLPVLYNDPRPTELSALPGSPLPIWLANQALLN